MFSFHKPKIYRSNLGCCICKAKSSSSRFTDSQKYENEFERCFRIQEKRSGEICNACVLLVKRWKKLSPENRLTKHWHHVVDARAGPGTKLSGNRRIVGHHQTAGRGQAKSAAAAARAAAGDVRPLSSSQANQQQQAAASRTAAAEPAAGASGTGSARTRTSSFGKARAIDTNVSTFTFGEPPSAYRRNCMAGESYFASSLSPLAASQGFAMKPQSALNSSAFESVIKRFRQRQQQQHIEQQRRQVNRQKRLLARQQQAAGPTAGHSTRTAARGAAAAQSEQAEGPLPDATAPAGELVGAAGRLQPASPLKRVKRLSENYGSLASYETCNVAAVLDSSIWRKEKICCGIIFRGLYNEVAVFPKLLRPCECKLRSLGVLGPAQPPTTAQPAADEGDELARRLKQTEDDEPADEQSPRPRVVKSGSVSSSTSGTGSMEQLLEEAQKGRQAGPAQAAGPAARRGPQAASKRPRSVPTKRRSQREKEPADGSGSPEASCSVLSSKESTSADSPGSAVSSSGNSSSRMILMIDGEHVIQGEVDDDEDDELVLADALESSNDASSSAESLAEMEDKNSSALAMG